MLFKAIQNHVNSGKSTLLLSCDHHSSASKAPLMTGLSTRPLSKALKSFSCAKLTTLRLLALMNNSPSDSTTRLVNACSCYLKTDPPFKSLGLLKDFNGLNVAQHSDAIKLLCKKHIERVLTTHGWSKPSPPAPAMPPAPQPVDAVTSLHAHQGPPENTAEHAAPASKQGFASRTLLGELLHAHVTCWPGIGYVTIGLSEFSTCLHDHGITSPC